MVYLLYYVNKLQEKKNIYIFLALLVVATYFKCTESLSYPGFMISIESKCAPYQLPCPSGKKSQSSDV